MCHCAGSLVGVVLVRCRRDGDARGTLAERAGSRDNRGRHLGASRDLVVGRQAAHHEAPHDTGDLLGWRAEPACPLEVAVRRHESHYAVRHEGGVVVTNEAEIDALTADIDPSTETFDKVLLRPRKSDITVDSLGLAWMPYWQDDAGSLIEAWG